MKNNLIPGKKVFLYFMGIVILVGFLVMIYILFLENNEENNEETYEETYEEFLVRWKTYMNENLFPIIHSLNTKLEGNIYTRHHTMTENTDMYDKQHNLYHIMNKIKPKKVLEIGFNAGFSTLFMKMIKPDSETIVLDLNSHKYVMKCFDRIKEDYPKMKIIPGSSYDVGLPQLIKEGEKFDLIHIDGDHRYEGAKKDFELCLKLCHKDTIIIFDDTNLDHLDKLCNSFVNDGLVKEYNFKEYKNSQTYKHRFFKNNNLEYFDVEKNKPVYVSLTSIFKKQNELYQTLKHFLNQTLKPDKIYLNLSEEPYILDTGFNQRKITNDKLYNLIKNNPIIEVRWVKNTGPYRKLLPVLKEKWDEDCIIITIDDDVLYNKHLVKNLVKHYNKHNCVIAYRAHYFDKKQFTNFNYENRHSGSKFVNKQSLYSIPTGVGSVLYTPKFFHKTGDLIFNEEIFLKHCSKQDDLWFFLVRVLNKVTCYNGNVKYSDKSIGKGGLWDTFNKKKNTNTIVLNNTRKELVKLGYTF